MFSTVKFYDMVTLVLNLNHLFIIFFHKLVERGYNSVNLIEIIKRCLKKNSVTFQKYSILDDNLVLNRVI